MHRDLKKAWAMVDVKVPNGTRPQRSRLTTMDEQLLRVVESLGGLPEEAHAGWWKQVAQRWVEAGYKKKAADSHRKHWARLAAKLDQPGVMPNVARRTEFP